MSEGFLVALIVIGGCAFILVMVAMLLRAAPPDLTRNRMLRVLRDPGKHSAEEFNAAIYWAFVTANDGVALHAAKQALARMHETVHRAEVKAKTETKEKAK